MHTSPGGHGGTCLLHSQPLSAAQIYLHSLLFSRELYCKTPGDCFASSGCLSSLYGVCDCWKSNIVPFFAILRNDVHYLSTDLRTFSSFLFIRAKCLNPATARWSFGLTQTLAEEITQYLLLAKDSNCVLCSHILVCTQFCVVMLYLWVLVCEFGCIYSLFVYSTNRMHPKSHQGLVGFRDILYRITFP